MVTNFLIEALQAKETVLIPGFGTFSTKPVSAVVDSETGVIKPPSSEIVFIDDYGYGDASDSLVEYILAKSNDEREKIAEEVNDFGKKIKEEVDQHDQYEIDGLGIFTKGLYGNITFKGNNDNFSGKNYGLPKLTLLPLGEDAIAGNTEKKQEPEQARKKFPEATLWGILIPSIIIVIIAVWLMIDENARNKATAFITGDKTEEVATTVPPANKNLSANNEITTDTNKVGGETSADNTNATVNNDKSSQAVTPTNTPQPNSAISLVTAKTGRFYLSVASYPNEANALDRRKRLIAQGYTEAKVIVAGAGKYRVSLADFATKVEAERKVTASENDFSSIWVFKF
ncbi:MAG: SPOR domain-containing protein [Bacteroidota bacterium]